MRVDSIDMHVRIFVLAAAMALVAPTGSSAAPGPAPQARKAVQTKGSATPKPAPKKVAGAEGDAPKTARAPRHLAKRLRKGKVPAAAARVERKTVAAPPKRLVPLASVRKPVRVRSLPQAQKVAFAPCAASLPPQAPRVALPKPGMDAAVLERQYRWPTGATLKIGFLDGHRTAREAVARTARAWTEHANLEFAFSLDAPPNDADILIRFDAPGCTSHVGSSSRYYAEIGMPSMDLCHLDQWIYEGSDPGSVPEEFRRVVLHEFGHALGLHHEHQSPDAQFEWNEEAVYAYYGNYHGWPRDYVDLWVFRQLDPSIVDTTAYDPLSIMHYQFPGEFTKSGVAFGGSSVLSALDQQLIAQTYPRKPDAKARRRFERKIAVRNDTGVALDVQLVHEIRRNRRLTWEPATEPSAAPSVRVAAGAERVLDGQGRRVKLVARSVDGGATWSEHAEEPLRIAPKGGYLDVELQTYVVVIDGPPDAPGGQTAEQLFAAASQALEGGDHEGARALFGEFVETFPSDALVPWARFNVVASWYEQQRWEEALQASYGLIVDFPRADPTIYAWYYGGVSALQLGWCDGARDYLGYVQDETSGAPEAWRTAAGEYLAVVEKEPGRWCW